MEDLPKYIFENILLRLPMRCVFQVRCVSKSWRNTIDNPFFLVLLKPEVPVILGCDQNGESISLQITVSRMNSIVESRKLASFPGIHGSGHFPRNCCNGLIYTKIGGPIDGVVLDLFSGKAVEVRGAQSEHSFYDERAIGFDASTRTYKLVRVQEGSCITADVYNFESRSWGPCEAPPLMIGGPGVYLSSGGSLNWLPSKDTDVIKSLISFNMREEKFCLTRLPVGRTFRPMVHPTVHIFPCDKRLGLCNSPSPQRLEVWILRELKAQEWSNTYHIMIPNFVRPLSGAFRVLGIPSGRKILIVSDQRLLSCDLKHKKWSILYDSELVGTITLYCTMPNIIPLP